MSIFDFGPNKIATFLFLHREIINVLDIVFTGYKTGEHRFLQPDSFDFSVPYEKLHLKYAMLIDDHEVLDYIDRKRLKITSLNTFHSLTDNFDFSIEFWNASREQLLAEKEQIDVLIRGDGDVEKDMRLAAYDLRKLLLAHQRQKDLYLQSLIAPKGPQTKRKKDNIVSINQTKAELHIYGEEIDIQVKSQEFLFLQPLLEKPDEIIPWKEHAQKIGLSISYYSNEDIARLVQDMKTKLRVKLRELGVSKQKITKLCNQIRAVRKAGYKFKPL